MLTDVDVLPARLHLAGKTLIIMKEYRNNSLRKGPTTEEGDQHQYLDQYLTYKINPVLVWLHFYHKRLRFTVLRFNGSNRPLSSVMLMADR